MVVLDKPTHAVQNNIYFKKFKADLAGKKDTDKSEPPQLSPLVKLAISGDPNEPES